jgi:cell division control protein 24
MASVAGRKKSIVSSSGIQIDTPVANNTLLNKAASQSTSLYQQCSQLRTRLLRIRGFDYYFSLASSTTDSRQSTDPVTHIWDLFSFGVSLCYLVDLLSEDQGFSKINQSTFDPEKYNANPDRAKKRAIALFAMQITDKISGAIPGCELFTVTDLWDRNSTDGLVKVRDAFVIYVIQELIPPKGSAYRHGNSEPSPRRCLRRASAYDTLSFFA